jgi:hypothetical protein
MPCIWLLTPCDRLRIAFFPSDPTAQPAIVYPVYFPDQPPHWRSAYSVACLKSNGELLVFPQTYMYHTKRQFQRGTAQTLA